MEEKRKVRMNGRRGNDEWFGEKREGEGERDAQVKRGRRRSRNQSRNAKTPSAGRERENREDECMITRKINAIGKDDLNRPRKKKNHTFG